MTKQTTQNKVASGQLPALNLTRYIVHIEDSPQIWSKAFDEIGEAVQSLHNWVLHRNMVNGCGAGLVFDAWSRKVVCMLDEGGQHPSNAEELTVCRSVVEMSDYMAEILGVLEKRYPVSAGSDPTTSDGDTEIPYIWLTHS